MSPIKRIEVIPLRVTGSDVDDCDGTVDTVVVRLTDAEGRTGSARATHRPEAVKAFLGDADGPHLEPPGIGDSDRRRPTGDHRAVGAAL